MESNKFINQVNELYETALAETIALLKNCENGRYIAIPNWEDEVAATSWNDVPISIWGVGLNDDEHICVRAFVNCQQCWIRLHRRRLPPRLDRYH